MAPKGISIYSVEELETLDRKDLKQLQENVATALNNSQDRAMRELRDKLAEAGIDAVEFAKYIAPNAVTPAPAPTSTHDSTSSSRSNKDEDARIAKFKQDHMGRMVTNATGKGKDYIVGKSRGQFPSWISEKIFADQINQLQIESDEDYAERMALISG